MHGTFAKRVTINLHSDDHARLAHAAQASRMALAPYVRSAALAYLDRKFVVPPRLDDLLARLIQESRRVGTNVNQIAARVNATRRAAETDVEEVVGVVRELEHATRALRAVLHNLAPEP